jgi:hypothetical protein
MEERAHAVRVHTHPESWKFFVLAGLGSGGLNPRTKLFASETPILTSAPGDFISHLRLRSDSRRNSIGPVTVISTVRRHSAYSIFPRVIQRVICKSTLGHALRCSSCEVA